MDKNLTMLTDFYQLTMANGYFENGMADTIAYFDMFFRTVPDSGGYVIMAGVEQLCEYLKNLSFTKQDIEYLRSNGKKESMMQFSNSLHKGLYRNCMIFIEEHAPKVENILLKMTASLNG